MRDFCLRFADAEEMQKTLIDLGFRDENQSGLSHPDIYLDVIGAIYEWESEEEEDPELIALPGYHVNARVMNDELDVSAMDGFIVTPKTPARVWA